MLSGEDFGYLKNEEQNRATIIAKKALLLGSVLFSVSCFVYITVNAYYFAYHDKESDITVIKSPAEPIKVVEENEGVGIKDMDKTIYDNIVGNRNLAKENFNNVRVIEQAATPLVKKHNVDKESLNNANNQPPVSQIKNNAEIVVDSQNNNVIKTSDSKARSDMIVYNSNTNTANQVNDASLSAKKEVVKAVEKPPVNKVIKGLSRVQVAALTSRNSAVEYWGKLSKSYPNLFSNLNYFISEVNLGAKGTFYRLQIGNFRSQVDAEDFCRKFISQSGKSKADCIIVE
jgi:hypothetical protein